jgi:hypothetical protein
MEQPVLHRPVGRNRLAKNHRRKTTSQPKQTNASAVTNGSKILLPLSEASFRRRLRDLFDAHVSDLGGWDNVSSAESALIRRAVVLIVELERRETMFAQVGYIDDTAFSIYQSGSNSLLRILSALGLHKKITPPTLDQYLRDNYPQREHEARSHEEDAAE